MEQLSVLIKGEIGREIVHLETVDSTNRMAMELGGKGAAHGTVVIADRQTKGSGRLGRAWVSPHGVNIYMSVIVRPAIKSESATLLTLMAAVACVKAIGTISGIAVGIKWPNDLIVADKKLGGILSEMKSSDGKILFAVIGIGINVNYKPEDFPPDLRAIATSVTNETGKEESRENLIAEILNQMDCWYGILINNGNSVILDEWRRLNITTGKPVKVIAGNDTFSGIAEDIDGEGMLLLRLPAGSLKKISAGDIALLR